jgi:tRNA G10  N-methylase Trm11
VGEKVVGSGEYKKGSASGGIWKKSTGKPAGPVYGTEMTELWHCTLDCPVQLLNSDVVGASRFFYTAKASQSERNAGLTNVKNNHPTVKPLDLMRWLCVLVTPPNGIILDPFSGSGSTGCAAVQLGFSFIGIEKESDYVKIAEARIEHWSKQSIPAASRVKKYVEQKVTNQKLSEFFDV